MCMKLSWIKSPLVMRKILGQSFSTLTADDKYSVANRDYVMQPIQMQLSNKLNSFCYVLVQFWNLDQLLNILNKKMTIIGYIIPKLQTAKDVVRLVLQKCRFRRPFDNQHIKLSQKVSKSSQQHLWHIYWCIWMKFSWGMFLLVICKILGLFVNTLTTDGKYSLLNRGNLKQPIQMQLSNKKKMFFLILCTYFISR